MIHYYKVKSKSAVNKVSGVKVSRKISGMEIEIKKKMGLFIIIIKIYFKLLNIKKKNIKEELIPL